MASLPRIGEGLQESPEDLRPPPELDQVEEPAEVREPPKPWTIRTDEITLFGPASALTDAQFRVMFVLEAHSRAGTTCYPGNKRLEQLCKRGARALDLIFLELERKGWIERVMPPPSCPGRTGFILLKRLHPESPAADAPEKVALARAHLREQREERTVPGGRRPRRGERGPGAIFCARTGRKKLRPEQGSLSLKDDELPSEGEANACIQRQRPGCLAEPPGGPEEGQVPPAPPPPIPPAPVRPIPPARPPAPNVPAPTPAAGALEQLTEEERAVFDSLTPRLRELLLSAPVPDLVIIRSEIRRARPAPPSEPLATLDDAIRALGDRRRADLGLVLLPKVTAGLREEIGDHDGSWHFLHQLLGRVAAGGLPPAVLLDALKCWRNQMARAAAGEREPIPNPAGYFTTVFREKVGRYEGGTDA